MEETSPPQCVNVAFVLISAASGQFVDAIGEHAVAGGFAGFATLAGALVDVLAAAAGALDDDCAPDAMPGIVAVRIHLLGSRPRRAQVRNGDSRAELC
jgi:hypothetical protein